MHRSIAPLLSTCVACFLAGPIQKTEAASLLGHWDLNETSGTTLADISGNGNTGNLVGGTTLGSVSVDPSLGWAARFDAATDSAVNVGNSFGGLQNDFSISGWVKPDAVAGVQRMFSSSRTLSNSGYGFGLTGSGLRLTTYGVKDYNAGSGIGAHAWSHIAMTLNNANDAELFINGVSQGVVPHGASAVASLNDFFLGRTTPTGSTTPSEEFSGVMDDVRVYSGVLTVGEIQSLGTVNGLRGYWALDETGGSTAYDSSGYQAAGNSPGTHVNALTVGEASVHPSYGTAYRFNGSNEEVDVGSVFGSIVDNFSVAAWINPDDLVGFQRVFSAVPAGGWGFGLNGGNIRFTTFGIKDYDIAAPVQTDEWQHIAMTFAGGDATFYLDGGLLGTVTGPSAANPTGNAFLIGRGPGGENFDGLIDEVRLYDRILGSDEIAALAQVIPEPSSLALLLAGGLGLAAWRRRR